MTDAEFKTLILAELDAVFRLACHLMRSRQEADDAVQETFLRALRSAHTFRLAAHGVKPWLFKILHNVIISRANKNKREHTLIEERQHQVPASAADDGASEHSEHASAAIDWDQIDQRLNAAISSLALPYRATFLLSAVEGLKYREIAEVTEVPVGTVMSRLSRARSTLASRLTDLAAEHGLGQAMRTSPGGSDDES